MCNSPLSEYIFVVVWSIKLGNIAYGHLIDEKNQDRIKRKSGLWAFIFPVLGF